jgi:probable HAF family extracellular repeat protein
MKAKPNLFRSLVVVLPVMLVAVAVALFGVGLRTAETQTTSYYYEVQDLGTFPWALGAGYGSYSSPSDINSLGHVVGVSGYRSDFEPQYHAFLYKDGQMKDLGTLGSDFSSATAINDFDQIVGASNNDHSIYRYDTTAFLYQNEEMIDLETRLLPDDNGSVWTLDSAYGINNKGQIVAYGWRQDGDPYTQCAQCALLLTPGSDIPPPADTTKPSTSATRSVEPNAAGWNKDNVIVRLNATDNQGGSGVQKITYSASGAQTIAQTDASADSVNVPLDKEGTTTLTYYATDNAGNVEDKKTLPVKIDKTAPTVKSTSPADRAINVSLSAKISATFLESGSGIDPSTLNTDTFTVTQYTSQSKSYVSAPVKGTVSYDEASKTVTFTPSTPLAKGSSYQAYIKGYGNPPRIEDKADNVLRGGWDYSWSFSTGGKLCCGL